MISIIIPAFNEDNAIVETILRCKKLINEVGNKSSEIIVINDGSTDNTSKVLNATGVVVLEHPQNIGYGRSLKDGIMASKNDTIIILDADGTYPIESLPAMLELYGKGFDMVVGARHGKHYDESFSKKLFRRILKKLVEYTAGRNIPDINSGLRIFSRKTVLLYLKRLCDTFSFTTSLTLAYMMTGRFVAYLPIDYEKRIGISKVHHFRDALRTLQYILEAIMYYNPIKIFLLFTTILIFSGFVFFTMAFFIHLNVFFYLGLGCILLSILMFGFGLVSIQLKQLISSN